MSSRLPAPEQEGDRLMSGGHIELVSLSKRFVEMAVDDMNLVISSGEFFSLLGPSGCGKTTTLRLIAGFEQPTTGKVLLDGVDVTNVAANKRHVNTVFQSYALFPFLDSFENVAFGLRNRGIDKATIRRRVGEALDLVHMSAYGKRRPGQLSGGQQQRVALARALVLDPAVLLLDEPLGALDAKLRRSLKVELKALQERVGITFLYVTHDQEEALTMSDRLAVMRAGKIVQMGGPHEIYDAPADTYVADFLGVSNLMEVDVIDRGPGSQCKVQLGDFVLAAEHGGDDAPDRAHAVIRPERVRIEAYEHAGSGRADGERPSGQNRVPAMVERLVYLGSSTQVMLRLAPGEQIQALIQNDGDDRLDLSQGTAVQVHLAPDALRVLAGHAISPTGEDLPAGEETEHLLAG
jgi:spermidine/putrescine transport system ATP-binding protein